MDHPSKHSASSRAYSRRQVLRFGAGGLAAAASLPSVNAFGKGEAPVKIGMVDPQTGTYAALGQSEIRGARMAASELNDRNGIRGRPVKLLVEDTAANTGQAVQKTRKLVHRNNVDFLMGAVSSSVALSVSQAARDLNKLYLCTGGHADAVTAKHCSWNTFRTCSTTWMLTAGDFETLVKEYGKRWFFLTPDYAFGHALVNDYKQQLQHVGGQVLGNALAPLGTTDFSSYLIKAQSTHPDLLVVLVNGHDLVNAMKQIGQFGLNEQMGVGGALINMESIESLPQSSRYGTWVMEWYWQQPDVPEVEPFVARFKQSFDNKVPTARNWFGYASMHALALACEKAKSLETMKVVRALEGLELPPEVGLGPNTATYRASDHQLIGSEFPGRMRSGSDYPHLFDLSSVTAGADIARSATAKGCDMSYPSS